MTTQAIPIQIVTHNMQTIAIDWRLTPQGQFVFLEAKPAPLFVNAQKQLGVEIDQAILSFLID